jgi:nucleoside-diphosphate-sugar epimerase
MSERRVLITGAGGFVGRALAAGFAELGWGVIALDRAFDDVPESPRIRHMVADLEEGVPDGVAEVDLVVHAAWVTTDPRTLGITDEEYQSRNLAPLTTMLRFTHDTRVPAFVFLSSSGVFGASDATGGLTDAHVPTGDAPYARAKLLGEEMTTDRVDPEVTAAHVVRLGYLFGPHEVERPSRQGVSLIARWVAAGRAGHPLEVRSDDPLREWTFAPDLAAALARIAGGPPAGRPVHLGSPHLYRDSEVAGLIAARFSGAEVVTVPSDGALKPPMIPSDIALLADFAWTDVSAALDALQGTEAVAGAAATAREVPA